MFSTLSHNPNYDLAKKESCPTSTVYLFLIQRVSDAEVCVRNGGVDSCRDATLHLDAVELLLIPAVAAASVAAATGTVKSRHEPLDGGGRCLAALVGGDGELLIGDVAGGGARKH